MLGQATRWHTDGTFFAAPKPFMQVYLLHAYDSNDNMVPCGFEEILTLYRMNWRPASFFAEKAHCANVFCPSSDFSTVRFSKTTIG